MAFWITALRTNINDDKGSKRFHSDELTSELIKRRRLDNDPSASVDSSEVECIWEGLTQFDRHRNDLQNACRTTARSPSWERLQSNPSPFRSLELIQLFTAKMFQAARKQLLTLEFAKRHNDLFSYEGSDDLCTIDADTPLGKIRDALYSQSFYRFRFRGHWRSA